MSTTPDRPAPPPGFVPPAPHAQDSQLEPDLPPPPPVPATPAGYSRSIGISLSQTAVSWTPAVALTLILLLTFVTWVSSYVGDSPVFTQNAWRAISGYPDVNVPLEQLMAKQGWPTAQVLDSVRSDWELMLPYIVLLVLAVVLAWLERTLAAVRKSVFPRPLQWIPALWPYRIPILAGLATIVLVLLIAQMINGFGIERALEQVVSERFAEKRTQAAGSAYKLESIDYEEKQELARFNLERTTWLYLVILLHILVVLAMIARYVLDRRGHKPPPRIVIQY
jgi:hypothetical protein